jgi:hypothetical protein
VQEYGAPHIREAVDAGKINVTTVARAIRGKSIEEQEELRTVRQLRAAVEAAPFEGPVDACEESQPVWTARTRDDYRSVMAWTRGRKRRR